MSKLCFNYPADEPAATPARDARPPAVRMMPAATCYSYPVTCFGYPGGMPRGDGNLAPAQPPLPDVRRMPSGSCFRY